MNTDAVEFRLFFAQRQDVNQNGSVMMKEGAKRVWRREQARRLGVWILGIPVRRKKLLKKGADIRRRPNYTPPTCTCMHTSEVSKQGQPTNCFRTSNKGSEYGKRQHLRMVAQAIASHVAGT